MLNQVFLFHSTSKEMPCAKFNKIGRICAFGFHFCFLGNTSAPSLKVKYKFFRPPFY
jgi:hypothetical protein